MPRKIRNNRPVLSRARTTISTSIKFVHTVCLHTRVHTYTEPGAYNIHYTLRIAQASSSSTWLMFHWSPKFGLTFSSRRVTLSTSRFIRPHARYIMLSMGHMFTYVPNGVRRVTWVLWHITLTNVIFLDVVYWVLLYVLLPHLLH